MQNPENLVITPFTRISWVSQQHKNDFEPVIQEISQMMQNAEIDSVLHDHRPCTWQTVSIREMVPFSKKILDMGMQLFPINIVGVYKNGFLHYSPTWDGHDANGNVYFIITKNIKYAAEFKAAYEKGDNVTQGKLLGFPDCCCRFFQNVWSNKDFDPIYSIAANTDKSEISDNNILLKELNPLCNPILRYCGVRISFHIPCSFTCKSTITESFKRLNLVKSEDMKKQLLYLLSLDWEWSSLNGISILKNKLFHLITYTTPYLKKCTIKYLYDTEIKS